MLKVFPVMTIGLRVAKVPVCLGLDLGLGLLQFREEHFRGLVDGWRNLDGPPFMYFLARSALLKAINTAKITNHRNFILMALVSSSPSIQNNSENKNICPFICTRFSNLVPFCCCTGLWITGLILNHHFCRTLQPLLEYRSQSTTYLF